jgi:hypothetical protein
VRGVVKWKKDIRQQALAQYGGSCACCGETVPDFLCIDHIDGNGSQHRKLVAESHGRGSVQMMAWLKRNGWPDGYRVLCWNCNWGIYVNQGVCPHELQK